MPDLVPRDTNKAWDAFVRDLGPRAGTGGFGGAQGGVDGTAPDCATGLVCPPSFSSVDPVGDHARVAGAHGDLVGARVVPRSGSRDLFVRLDLARMPVVTGVPSGGLLYGLRFAAGGERYEVRAQRVPGADFDAKGGASFGLFRQDAATGLFTKVATFKGGYGTTGDSVVFAIPMNGFGGGRLSDVRAFTGAGTYLGGATKLLDSLRLAP